MGLTVPIYSSGTGTLLWQNQNPTAAYAEQKVSLDLSKYTFCLLMFKYFITGQDQESIILVRVGCTDNIIRTTSYTTLVQRTILIEKDGVTFYRGMQGTSQNNNYMIPYQIYGIK